MTRLEEIDSRIRELDVMPPRNFWTGLRFTPESARAHYDSMMALRNERHAILVKMAKEKYTTQDFINMVDDLVSGSSKSRGEAVKELVMAKPELLLAVDISAAL